MAGGTTITTRFDPVAGEDYGLCTDCGVSLASEGEAHTHMSSTFHEAEAKGGSKGHRISILNPSRGTRVERGVRWIVEDAVRRAVEEIDDLVEQGHASTDEIREALRWYSDFSDAWDEYINEKEA